MALKLLHTSGTPLGEYDGLDTDLAGGFLGGEVATFGTVLVSSSDKGAGDVVDGYVNSLKRVVVQKAANASTGMLMLVDDGTTGYGMLFGTVVGGTVGQVSTGGAVLGPATYVGSGKLTCWATPGLFGVTLDAVDTTASTGLVPTNSTLVPGAKLYPTAGGLLSPAVGSATQWAARFVDFETNRGLVNTPNRLASALNSPSSTVTGVLPAQLTMAVISFAPNQ